MLEDKLLQHGIKLETYKDFLNNYIRKNKEEKRLQKVYLQRAQELLGGVSIDTNDFAINNAQKKRDKSLKKIEEIEEKLNAINIHEIIIQNILDSKKKQLIVKKGENYKRKIKKDQKDQKDEIRENFYKRCREGGRIARQNRYFIRSSWKWLRRTDAKLPEYMRRNLREMPNNKGYIFRGIQYYGEKKAEKNKPTILFEKNRGVLKIHEITEKDHKIYEKKNKKSKNKLISDIKRGENPFLKNSYNLLDYIKNK